MTSQSFRWDSDLYQKSSSVQFELGLMAIERLKPKDFELILDLGAGTARLSIEIAKRIPNGKVIALEISSEQCEQAKLNLRKYNINNVEIMCMNALDMNYKNKFDAVFSNSAIHWIPNLKKAYQLIYDSLKGGGRIVVQTGLKENGIVAKVVSQMFIKYRDDLNNFRIPWKFLSIKENERILRKCNFRDIKIEPLDHPIKFKNERELFNYWRAAALVPFFTFLPEEVHDKFLEDFKQIYYEINSENPLEFIMRRVFIYARK
ncbi:MAG: class I SAM-dependent methyltransferase [Promethearchaeota archaeon]